MGVFFGTDGLRGKACDTLTSEIAYRVGNAISRISETSCKILIGSDTRLSADYFALSLSVGLIEAGSSVTYVGVCPTAGISFLTKEYGYDYGVVISASHNPAEFNGIKIFNKNGTKIGDYLEKVIEKNILNLKRVGFDKLGRFEFDSSLVQKYEEFLIDSAKSELKNDTNFSDLKIVLDCSNGAAFDVAPKVFKALGAKIVCVGVFPDGININKNCGSLHIDFLKSEVIKNKADMGFAYDGDSDRLIAISSTGKIVDGDQVVYIFANHYLKNNKLKNKVVVGTKHTNMGIEKAFAEKGISLIRTDIGDKYVSETLEKNNLLIGGEQSGHVFVLDKLQTGDGVLNSLLLTSICKNENQSIEELLCQKTYNQTNLNVQVENKEKILKNDELISNIKTAEKQMRGGRIMVRGSGTEPVIRIMTESEDEKMAEFVADNIEKMIRKIDSRGGLCVE